MATWHDVTSARDQWADAPVDEDDGDTELLELLAAAKVAVLAFAPDLTGLTFIDDDGYIVEADADTVPTTYRKAQLMKCRIMWNAGKLASTGSFDNGDFDTTTYSMEREYKQMLRPKRGKPVIV